MRAIISHIYAYAIVYCLKSFELYFHAKIPDARSHVAMAAAKLLNSHYGKKEEEVS